VLRLQREPLARRFTSNDRSNPSFGCSVITSEFTCVAQPSTERKSATSGLRKSILISVARRASRFPVAR